MKTSKLLLAFLALALLCTSCIKRYVTEEYYTNEYITQGMGMVLVDFNIKANQWVLDEEGGYYSVTLNVPQITADVVQKGTVTVSRRLTDASSNSPFWTPLPIVRANNEPDEQGNYFYSTYIDFEWSVGTVNVFVTATDFYTEQSPEEMFFRVAVFY